MTYSKKLQSCNNRNYIFPFCRLGDERLFQVIGKLASLQKGVDQTRRERLTSAIYSRLKKRKTLFLKKLTYILLQNIKEIKGGPFRGNNIKKSLSMTKN